MIPSTTLTIADGVRVVVPDSLDLITPYVLQEQLDWFEDEIKFLRRLLQPGQKVIDIGANYGVYALSMAQTVGAAGRVWAFEPASSTASLLAQSVAANGLSHVVVEQSAISSSIGTAELALNENSELNALVHDRALNGVSEAVALVTLDSCLEKYAWEDIDFLKIDAEGEEAEILKGGECFFDRLSPLVQYEVKAGEQLHLELVQAFAQHGYRSFRLVPGPDLLVPFSAELPADAYLLNLFCCKPDQAARLAARGFLVDSAGERPNMAGSLPGKGGGNDPYGWRNTLVKLPYGAELANLWERTVSAGNSGDVEQALSWYAVSQDLSKSPAERFCALEDSFNWLRRLCEREPSYLRLASLARVARDYGARLIAVNALVQLNNSIAKHRSVNSSEPFLPPAQRFDSLAPGQAVGNWVVSAILEAIDRNSSFSSFYTGASARQQLEAMRALGFADAETNRRLGLLQRRYKLPVQ